MSLENIVIPGLRNTKQELDTQTARTFGANAGILNFVQNAINISMRTTINNMLEQLRASDWQVGIRTEKQLLGGDALSLAKA